MPKKTAKVEKDDSKKINVEIAPLNSTRLNAYIKSQNDRPDRSRPAITVTDVLNEALDEFFIETAVEIQNARPEKVRSGQSSRKGSRRGKEES
ncbi:MAG: hypothetical protein ACLQMF_19275 [Rectinemataceae bacterium]